MTYTITETPREAYDRIVEYFSRPNAELSKNEENQCYYRHPEDGRACAVGCLFPDEAYDPKMDDQDLHLGGLSVLNLNQRGDIVRIQRPDTLRFLDYAQTDHDLSPDVPSFLDKLESTYRSMAED